MRNSGGPTPTSIQGVPRGVATNADASFFGYERKATDLSKRGGSREPMKYKAVQVVNRTGDDPERTLPIGSSFIGQLVKAIDTRDTNDLVRVVLPYGGSFDHDRRIDKGSMIFGRVNYPGQGEKVYIQFNRLLFPDGREFKIEAEALSSTDYSSGLVGVEHDGTAGRILATTGLTMLSGITDVLTEKESLSVFEPPTPKSTLHNAFMNGISKSAQTEGQRESDKVADQKEYVTIPSGQDLIVGLTETFKGELK
jgi:Bacterial conjugation TrbI-like protein